MSVLTSMETDHSCLDVEGSYNCTCNYGYDLYTYNVRINCYLFFSLQILMSVLTSMENVITVVLM